MILVETLMDSLRFDEFLLSPDALREGLVLDRLNQRDGTLERTAGYELDIRAQANMDES
jgi:exopolyphosphatase/pppGpp-phosphohydrolase